MDNQVLGCHREIGVEIFMERIFSFGLTGCCMLTAVEGSGVLLSFVKMIFRLTVLYLYGIGT